MTETNLNVLILSCSLNPNSNSAKLAAAAKDMLDTHQIDSDFIDMRELEMPFCGAPGAYDHPSVAALSEAIGKANAILLAAPVYNFDLNAAVKNVIELTGSAWEDKVVGLMVAAGGARSYMSPIGIANSLMFDFRSHIVPRFVYATRADFDVDSIDAEIKERLQGMVDATLKLAKGLALVG
jgi:FMN reductase